MLRMASLAFALVFSLSTLANAKAPDLKSKIADFTLENGLRLVVVPDRRAPVVTHMIWYKVGSADDPVGKSGIAHFLEHLMFKGTSNTPAGEFSSAVSSRGGQENAFTSYDYTAYFQKVSPDALAQMMAYEADRMRNLVLTDDVVLPERDVILEERSGRVDNNPGSILNEFVQAALYVHHPYGTPIIGWEHEIRELDREDALAFYERWYQPWNATVVVAGDVDPKNVLAEARETYGKIVASNPPEAPSRLQDPEMVVSKTVEYADKRVTNPSWRKTFQAPSYWKADRREGLALDLLATILGDSASSRIYRNIVLEQEIATSAGAFYQGSGRDSGYFGIYGTPRGDNTLEDVANAVETELSKIIQEGITQEELDRARRSYLNALVFSQDSQVGMARLLGSILSSGGTLEDFHGWPDQLAEVTVEDVNKAAKKYLDDAPYVLSRLLPEKE